MVVLERDKHICQTCGVNVESLFISLRILKKSNSLEYKNKLKELCIPEHRTGKISRLLDCDHIIPISKGGGAGIPIDYLLNLQAICLHCHHQKNISS